MIPISKLQKISRDLVNVADLIAKKEFVTAGNFLRITKAEIDKLKKGAKKK
jgi:hypothetical protein